MKYLVTHLSNNKLGSNDSRPRQKNSIKTIIVSTIKSHI